FGVLDGGAGNDTLIGQLQNPLSTFFSARLLGGAGDDTLRANGAICTFDGGAGNDTYIVDGTSNVTIDQFDAGAGKIDTLRFTAGTTPESITLGLQERGLILNVNGIRVVTIANFLADDSAACKVDRIIFDDAPGVEWTIPYIESLLAT